MSDLDAQLDVWAEGGAAALVLEQPLRPVVGTLVFPPTFAPAKRGDASDYCLDVIDGQGVVTLDTPGAEANRLEPLFLRPPLSKLVPQITIKAGSREKSLLELGHRAADALLRSVADKATLVRTAFEQVLLGDHATLAAFAPTSLVFGTWDSRGTGAKLPRLIEARIDAYGVERRQRAAQYFAAFDFVETGLLATSKAKGELDQRSAAGFRDSPSGRVPGGVEIVEGGRIVRTITIHLAALQQLGAGVDQARGRDLRQYILGLALAAATAPLPLFLRQGCSLVPPRDAPPATWRIVGFDGREAEIGLPHDAATAYACKKRDSFFPSGFEAAVWMATKEGAAAEVAKRARSDDEAAAA